MKKRINGLKKIDADSVSINYLDIKDTYFVSSPNDFPNASAGVINLPAGSNWYVLDDIDLGGLRLNCLGQVAIHGFSSETCSLYSSLDENVALITTSFTLPIQNITLGCNDTARIFNLTGDGSNGLDMMNVNFGSATLNCGILGTISGYSNVVLYNCAVLDASDGLTFTGSIDTVALNQSLFSGLATSKSYFYLPDTLTITRRFRIVYSSFVATSGRTGISYSSATIPVESFILDTVNFSGGGNYLSGISDTSNLALFVNCIGVKNSSEQANYYMQGNATATVVSLTSTYYKVAGTTTANDSNQKFTHTNNKLVYIGSISANFMFSAMLSLSSGNNQDIKVGVYKNGTLESASVSSITSDGNGKFLSCKLQCLCALVQNDYLEVFVSNETSTVNITVSDLNVIVFRL